jgi:16S rRNA (uracil1498-N3)-methyltransferase
VERGRDAGVATFVVDALRAGESLELDAGAAHHVRVRRLSAGDRIRVTDGRGRAAMGTLEAPGGRAASVRVEDVREVPRRPAIELYVPVADRDRMLWLAEKCAELEVTSWRPVMFARSRSVSPRGEGEGFATKVRARMIAAVEQSGGAWMPDVHDAVELSEALRAEGSRLLCDVGGDSILSAPATAPVSLMVGPEGGLEVAERASLLDAGWRGVRLAGNTLRFETAAVAAAAIVRARL